MATTALDRDLALRDVSLVRRIVREHIVDARVFLFGSYATGHAARSSDIDVAVMGRAPLPATVMLELRDALESANTLARVDVVDLGNVEPAFRDRVLREGVEWID